MPGRTLSKSHRRHRRWLPVLTNIPAASLSERPLNELARSLKYRNDLPGMKRTLVIAAIVISGALIGTFVYFKGKRYEVVIPQGKIDSALSEKFPATKKYLIIFDITYFNPQVTLLEEEDRVRVGLDATLNIRLNDEPKKLGGGATVTSGIRYDGETQEFFLDDAVFERLEIQGVPEKWLETVTELASGAGKEFVQSKPVYRLEAKDAKTTAAKLLLKDFEVREQAIHVTLGL